MSKTTTAPEAEKPFDTLGFIMDWEGGDVSEERLIDGFQHLVDNGMAWQLQGVYGRTAAHLIKTGLVADTHNVLGLKGKKAELRRSMQRDDE